MENKKRLIDLDEAIDALGVEDKDIYCKYFLEERPTVDAVEVIHAKWIFVNDRCGCSNCRLCLQYNGNGVIIDMSHLPYCPHCGARMDLED